ncbi:MAG: hypothetical protein H0U79_05805 [Solirubrobacterales bacterium]|nr:hypothetical protein [Solirubrobacterales bacterium]
MIYCVVPEEMAPELYDRLAHYYEDDPNVEVIIDRRSSERRARRAPGRSTRIIEAGSEAAEEGPTPQRQVRDRRRPRITGDFPTIVDEPALEA